MEIHFDKVNPEYRYKVMMGLVVPRPIAFVSTRGRNGSVNVAPFSFYNIMSVDPAVLVVGINDRPSGQKDTVANIEATGEFVVNVVSDRIAEAMNACSLESPTDIDEFDLSGLTPVPSVMVKAPRVKEAPANLECRLIQTVPINDSRRIFVASIVHIHVDDTLVGPTYRIDQDKLNAVGRMGGDIYTRTNSNLFVMSRPNTDAMVAEYRKRKG